MATKSTRSKHITEVRQATTEFLESYDDLKSLRREWDWEFNSVLEDASGADPEVENYEAGDFAGTHEGLVKADIAAVYTSLESLDTWLSEGHGTNLQKVRQ